MIRPSPHPTKNKEENLYLSLHHGTIQAQISFLLKRDFPKKFSTISELSLVFKPKGATPDLCIYEKMHFDYAQDEDVIKMTAPPLTTVEILSPTQALDGVILKIRKNYFPNGVKSAWVVLPPLKTIVLLLAVQEPLFFSNGKLIDPATGIELSVEEIFEV